jgi:hypothetical protein
MVTFKCHCDSVCCSVSNYWAVVGEIVSFLFFGFPNTDRIVVCSGPFDAFADALTSKTFYEWCCASLNNENLEFYFSVELYRTLPPQARAVKAAEMLRHFVREGASAQINIDHSVRSDLEAALPPSLLELVEKMTADAKAKAAAGGPAATSAAAAVAEDDSAVAASGKKGKVKTKKTTTAADDSTAPLNIAADIFDVAQSRVYELMERDLWARFRVDQAGSAASPRGKLKTKKPLAAATPSTPSAATPNANATTTTTTTASSTPTATQNSSSNNVKQVSPRRKTNAATTPNTVSSVSATLQAPAMVTQIKRVNGKIVVYRKGE